MNTLENFLNFTVYIGNVSFCFLFVKSDFFFLRVHAYASYIFIIKCYIIFTNFNDVFLFV